MKKDCPNNINDFDRIKTFKLIAKKFIELGGTIDDIKKLYNENKGITSEESQESQESEQENQEPENNAQQDDSLTSRLFDDDFFDNIYDVNNNYDEISKMFDELSYSFPLSTVLINKLNIDKPRGFKFVKHTENKYDSFIYLADYYDSKYAYDFRKMLESFNWTYINNDFPNYVTDFVTKNLSEDFQNIKTVLLSPDKGLMLIYVR
jgi:hypothetical protein